MSHHLDDEGRFQSDRHPGLAPDKIVLSFRDWRAVGPLLVLASNYAADDPGLSADIRARVESIRLEEAGGIVGPDVA